MGRDGVRGDEYICPGCHDSVILKQGKRVIHHFAHRPMASCAYAVGETVRHMEMKWIVAQGLAWMSPHIEVPTLGNRRRADVAVEHEGHRFIVECQHSPLTAEELEEREFDYAQVGSLIWVFDASLFFKHYRPKEGFSRPGGRVSEALRTIIDRDQRLLMLWEDQLYEVCFRVFADERNDEWGHRIVTRYTTWLVDRVRAPWIPVAGADGPAWIAPKPAAAMRSLFDSAA